MVRVRFSFRLDGVSSLSESVVQSMDIVDSVVASDIIVTSEGNRPSGLGFLCVILLENASGLRGESGGCEPGRRRPSPICAVFGFRGLCGTKSTSFFSMSSLPSTGWSFVDPFFLGEPGGVPRRVGVGDSEENDDVDDRDPPDAECPLTNLGDGFNDEETSGNR